MSNKGVVVSVVAAGIAVGTYLLLESLHPHNKEEAKAAEGVTVDQVFSGTLKPAPATEVASAPEAAPVEAAPPPAEPAPASSESAMAPAEPEPASMPAPSEPEPAAMPVAEPEPAATPAPAPAPKVAAAPKPEPKAAPAPKTEPAPKAAPEPKPLTPAPAKTPPAPKTPAAKTAPATKTAAAPIKPWWGAERADKLSLVYAGSAAYKRAVVLMFNGTFDSADSANKNLQVQDSAGKPVKGQWELGATNKKMLLFPVGKPGVYKVAVGAGLADSKSRALPAALQGPVQVQ